MFELRNVKHYASKVQEKYPQYSEEVINTVLLQGMKNLCRSMLKGWDIRIRSVGVIFRNKKTLLKYGRDTNKPKFDQTD